MDEISWTEGHRLVAEIGDEEWLVRRIKQERELKKWTQADLARELTKINHPFGQSAISKLEAGKRERGVTIDEAIGFSKVFGIALGELLLPPTALPLAATWRDFNEAAEHRNTIRHAQDQYDSKLIGLRKDARASETFRQRLLDHRAEVMAKIELELREIFERDNQIRTLRGEKPHRWPGRKWIEANRPPAVITIDDILEEGQTND